MKSEKQQKILVTIRKRPLTKKEKSKGETDIVLVHNDIICVNEPKEKVDLTKYVDEHRYKFDRVYDQTVSTEEVSSKDLQFRCITSRCTSIRRS